MPLRSKEAVEVGSRVVEFANLFLRLELDEDLAVGGGGDPQRVIDERFQQHGVRNGAPCDKPCYRLQPCASRLGSRPETRSSNSLPVSAKSFSRKASTWRG